MTHSGSLPNRVAEWHPLYLPIALDQSGIMANKNHKKGDLSRVCCQAQAKHCLSLI